MRWKFAGLIVLFLTAVFVIRSDFFNIKKVDVQMDKVACTNTDQIKNLTNLIDSNIILLNSSYVKDSIKSKFLCIKDVKISKHFPDRLNLFVFGREAQALLLILKDREATPAGEVEKTATPSAEEIEGIEGLEVDEENIIFAKVVNIFDIPKIYLHENLILGQIVPSAISDSLKAFKKIKSYGLDVKEAQVLDGSFIIYPNIGVPRIVFKLGENLDSQLASLQLILNQAKIDEKELEFIDLRFDKPVVKLAPKKS